MISIEQDRVQLEQEYLIQQQMLSKSATLNEIVLFKKELEKSERQREQLSDHLEVYFQFKTNHKKFISISFRCWSENVMKKKNLLLKV